VRDMLEELAAAHRAVGRRAGQDGEVVAVQLRRAYDAELTDVWDAVTDPARLARWFSPVSGELRVGGTFQVEGNAAGEVLQCAPPEHLRVTWCGPTSLVDVRLTTDGDRTVVDLEHSVPIEIAQSGAGALFVGPGWDVGVLALALFLRGQDIGDPAAWESSIEVQRYSAGVVDAWSEAALASGTTTPDEVDVMAGMARAQFTPDLVAQGPAPVD
jgi:uncharacterized protein YndB with AHSA1/START domain